MLLYTKKNDFKRSTRSFTNIRIDLMVDINDSILSQKHNIRLDDIMMAPLTTGLRVCSNPIIGK